MKNLVLYGAGGMAREAVLLVGAINEQSPTYNFLGFVVDSDYYAKDMTVNGILVLGDREWLIRNREEVVCCCAIGNQIVRKKIQESLKSEGVQFVSLVSPTVYIDPSTRIGDGCIIQTRCMVSVNINIGDGVFLNTETAIGHDVIIEDFVTCYPRCQISGRCRIETMAQIGAMAFLNEKITVGRKAVVAPGSIVFTRVKEGTHVLGNPAHRIQL